jgi:hypothetical protein
MAKGFTQKWSVSSGSRAVMWPATPSEKPGQLLLAVQSLLLHRGELRGGWRPELAGNGRNCVGKSLNHPLETIVWT